MTDVRLTATNPEDSSVVPVACNEKGEILLAEPEVVEGPAGPEGPEGPPGPQGDSIVPDPQDVSDGRYLMTLNGACTWGEASFEMPYNWSNAISATFNPRIGERFTDAFDGNQNTYFVADSGSSNNKITFTFPFDIPIYKLEIRQGYQANGRPLYVYGQGRQVILSGDPQQWFDTERFNGLTFRQGDVLEMDSGPNESSYNFPSLGGMRINDEELLDRAYIRQAIRFQVAYELEQRDQGLK